MINELFFTQMTLLHERNLGRFKEKFWNWKETCENKGLKVNIRTTKATVSGSKQELIKSKVDPSRVYGRRVKVSSVLYTKRLETAFMADVQK